MYPVVVNAKDLEPLNLEKQISNFSQLFPKTNDEMQFFFNACILFINYVQSPQVLVVHFEMALIGRKTVAMSKLMIASNSQRRYIL